MKPMTLARLASLCAGRVLGDGETVVDGIASDTRKLPVTGLASPLFVALEGASFDGHAHVAAAAERGAVAALVSREVAAGIAQIVVADTERALADIARALQAARAGKVLAITGSNGKTSVKTLLLSILGQAGGAYANPGNFNNEIGLPLSVIAAPEDARFYVYEMGAGKPGDIAYLTAIVTPEVSLVNNVAPAHLARMGSLLAIAETKAAVYDDLAAGGTAVINADDAYGRYFESRAAGRRVLRFALEASAEVSAAEVVLDAGGSRFRLRTPAGDAGIRLHLPGRHNVANALAAAAMALAVGVDIEHVRRGLESARPVPGRLAVRRLACGARLIDDSYNANPGSLAAAIDTLASVEGEGEGWLVLGEMRELGVDEVGLHAEAGHRAKAAGIARLYAIGALAGAAAEAFGDGARRFDSHAELAGALRGELREGVRVLVKGSRGSAMDRVVAALLAGENADAA
ncbi:UDP-N-acetylmuramoyl-tripeptide--D-alanyl-D-alanine ligase [Lysobacter pythonis]|uniref:UDP-N-acetylmuramoyl-tripeptide--D-alanyl-D-alanine ligase n=1 Tax=Solilutibacter pythonis TaxID=2483112 RepID=A0A3M2I702_9GAMM|nr:UDP-N-acetylmuramoyl-tripeptide--D-alanyl-D-alanine ligase [Lysobacter pythonis]RMH94237.1 UDP-N-acetylmuramoyl-tripeptide--D-alanyl-D-alanine ligase [Lysobacter pythonis]